MKRWECDEITVYNVREIDVIQFAHAMQGIFIFIIIFLFINFTHSQNYGDEINSYDPESTFSGGYSNMWKKYSQTSSFQQPYKRGTVVTEEIIQSPGGTTKVITTQQRKQSAKSSSSFRNFG